MPNPFRYLIRSRAVAKELVSMGFTVFHPAPDYTMLEAPTDLSNRKARKLIHLMIEHHKAEAEYETTRAKCEGLVRRLNSFNGGR